MNFNPCLSLLYYFIQSWKAAVIVIQKQRLEKIKLPAESELWNVTGIILNKV